MAATGDSRPAAVALAGAAIALGQALQVANGHVHPRAVGWLSLAVALAAAALLRRRWRRTEELAAPLALAVLGAGVVAQLVDLATHYPGMYFPPGGATWPLRLGLAIAAAGLVAALSSHRWLRAFGLLVLLGAHFALGLWYLRTSGPPHIDVHLIHRDSLDALLAGRNPYGLTFPIIYSSTQMYGPEQIAGGRLAFGYCYPPVPLLLALPGHLLGDYRLSQLAAMTGTGAMIALLRPGRVATLAAALLLFTPRLFYVLEQGWTDPLVLLLLVATLFLARRAPRAMPVALGLFLAAKQYTFLALPGIALLLLADGRPRRRVAAEVVAALGVALAATGPLALWDLRAFVWDVFALQIYSPFRADSLSYLAAIAALGGPRLPSLIGFLAVIPVAAAALRWGRRTPAGMATATALMFLVFVALNKQAFANYYFLIIGTLCAAVAATPFGSAGDALDRRAEPA